MIGNKKVVVIGGGHGLAAILRGIKHIEGIDITAIVSVADDGGSTGVLRERYNIPAVGDIRDVLVALAESETLLSELMDYRFEGEEDGGSIAAGHSLGNLIITSLIKTSGNIMEAIYKLSKVLNVQGTIVPSSLDLITLVAEMEDGTIVVGESNIPLFKNRINQVMYYEEVTASRESVKAIEEADLIVFGIGSLYTSVIPNLIIDGIRDAINASSAKKIYMCNAMTESGETDGFTVSDHVAAIEKHLKGNIDTVVVSTNELPEGSKAAYAEELATEVVYDEENCLNHEVLKVDLLSFENNIVRHDSEKIEHFFRKMVKEI